MSSWYVIPARVCFINSSFRQAGTSSSFSVALPSSPLYPELISGATTYVAVRSAVIPLSYESINSNNNVLSVTETSGGIDLTFSAVIGVGQYDLLGFQTALNQALTAASAVNGYGATYNCEVSTVTGSCTFQLTTSPGITVVLHFDSPTTADTILGLPTTGDSTPFSDSASYTGPGIISISGPRYIQVRSPAFVSDYYENRIQAESNILLSLPVTASALHTLTWSPAYPTSFARIASTIDFLPIDITDENGVILNLRDQPVQIELGIYVSTQIR